MTKPADIRPPFTRDTALAKVQAAEDAWNSRDPKRVSLAYSEDSQWRNRSQFVQGRDAIEKHDPIRFQHRQLLIKIDASPNANSEG